MSDQPLTGKVGLDTTEFKTAIAEMNREIRVIESAFRASAAALGDWGNSASGVEMRIKALTDQIGVQEQKVSALRDQYLQVAESQGEGSRAAQELEIKLNKETETLNKMKTELGNSEQALSEMGEQSGETGEQVEELGQKEDRAVESTSKLSTVMSGLGDALKVGVAAIAGLAAAVAGAGAAITKLVLDTAEQSAALVDLSAKTGISTERLQELAYVGDQVGTSQDVITGSLSRLTRSMDTARQQTGDYADKLAAAQASGEPFSGELGDMAAAFQQLGVSVTDSSGNLRDSEAVFSEAITALGGIASEADRDALAMSIFGRSAMELNPLIKAGADEIARLSQEARDVGAVMSGEDVAAMEAFDDSLASLQAGLKGTLGTLATAFLPAFEGLAGKAKGYLSQFTSVVQGADGDLTKIATGVGQLLGQIAQDMASQGPQMLTAGLEIIQGVIDAIITNLPMLIDAAVQMVTSLVQFLIANLPMLMEAGVQLILALVNGIVPQLPMLIESAIQMIVTLANGIAAALPQLLPVIAEIIPQIILVLVENLPLIIEAALNIIIALAEGLVAALPTLIAAIPQIVEAIFNALIEALPMIGEAAVQLVMTLVTGIVGALPTLGPAAVKLVTTLVTKLTELRSKIIEVGGNIVKGVWAGIQAKAAWFGEQVKSFFKGIVDSVKDALGIQSPSKVFAGIGSNMALGLGQGFAKSFGDIERSVSGAVGGLASMQTPSLGGVGSAAASSYSMGGVHITINGNGDARAVGRAAEDGVRRALRAVGAR